HVVRGRFTNDLAAGAELSSAQDIAGADNDGQLHASLNDSFGLARDVQGLVDADTALAAVPEPFAAQFQDDALVLRLKGFQRMMIVHNRVLPSVPERAMVGL